MKEIRGQAKNIRALLANARYDIDYYQREYRWGEKQVSEALDDLTGTFRTSQKRHPNSLDATDHDRYFLGSIVISESTGKRFITDGQQRLTTVTLLLIALHRRLPEGPQRTAVSQLIYSYRLGKTSFNLDVDDRTECVDALFHKGSFVGHKNSDSVIRMVENYELIEEKLHEAFDDMGPRSDGEDPMPLDLFIDWLIENVYFIEVTASSDADAYSIFETMNDRGLQLTPTELLKSYLLSRIDPELRREMNKLWKEQVAWLRSELVDETADANAIKTWLRSQYTELPDKSTAGREPDRRRINSEFHRWVGDNTGRLKLHTSDDFCRFIKCDFLFYTSQYAKLQQAAWTWTEGLESVYRNARSGLRDRNDLYLASLLPEEDGETTRRKLRTVAAFVEVVVARLYWRGWLINYGAMYDAMQRMIVKIRRKSVDEMMRLFECAEVEEWWFKDAFDAPPGANGYSGVRRPTHRLLARMVEYVEVESGLPSRYKTLVKTGGEFYDVEHIWANHYERFKSEFPQEKEFDRNRNRLGALVLLPSSVNRSLSDKTFAAKRSAYAEPTSCPNEEHPRNLLARTLVTEPAHIPGFREFARKSGLPFEPCDDFSIANLETREKLYQELARRIWSMDAIREAGSG